MARPFVEIKVRDNGLNAILDTGSWRSYIREEFAGGFPEAPVQPFEVRLGGQTLRLSKGVLISGSVKDTGGKEYFFSGIFFPVKDLGAENGRNIDILVGSLLLEDWGAVIDDSKAPPAVDYRRLREGMLVEL
ncbi:MAG: hypothetical protein ACE5PV_17565 [Candidatus Poribacteria bacterium]